jgi:hypothetical protein
LRAGDLSPSSASNSSGGDSPFGYGHGRMSPGLSTYSAVGGGGTRPALSSYQAPDSVGSSGLGTASSGDDSDDGNLDAIAEAIYYQHPVIEAVLNAFEKNF